MTGAVGNGQHDDTAALAATLKKWAGCKIIYIPFGSYVITSTLYIPAGSRIVGESWAQIKAQGSFFADFHNPKVAVQVGLNLINFYQNMIFSEFSQLGEG